MMNQQAKNSQNTRREFISDLGHGFTGIALASLLGTAAEASDTVRLPHVSPKAKSVIWFFMNGGTSHLESFDPKPALNTYAGKTIDESP